FVFIAHYSYVFCLVLLGFSGEGAGGCGVSSLAPSSLGQTNGRRCGECGYFSVSISSKGFLLKKVKLILAPRPSLRASLSPRAMPRLKSSEYSTPSVVSLNAGGNMRKAVIPAPTLARMRATPLSRVE